MGCHYFRFFYISVFLAPKCVQVFFFFLKIILGVLSPFSLIFALGCGEGGGKGKGGIGLEDMVDHICTDIL